MTSRRTALGLALAGGGALAALVTGCARQPLPDPRWLAYKARFLQSEGRIVDTGNGGVSHSEGQGYGMLFAAAHNDRAAFDALWGWTQRTLLRPDGLHAWRYTPGATPAVADPNNASDGDLLMAWALLRAAKHWGGDYADAAHGLATALKAAVVEADGKTYLLPGLAGFAGDGTRVVNLSYWIFPALRDLAAHTKGAVWSRVYDTGVALVDQARFGPRQLPPDWLETVGEMKPAEKFPKHFGYDAVRVPLNLIWGGAGTPARLSAINTAWSSFSGGAPAWIDVVSDETSPEKQSAGMSAIAYLTAAICSDKTPAPDAVPALDVATDYYSASLLMQVSLCLTDMANSHAG